MNRNEKDFGDKTGDWATLLVLIWFMIGVPLATIYSFATDYEIIRTTLIWSAVSYFWLGILGVIILLAIIKFVYKLITT